MDVWKKKITDYGTIFFYIVIIFII